MNAWALLAATLFAFEAGVRLQRQCNGMALLNPVLVAVVLMTTLLCLTGLSAAEYIEAVQPLTLLLGPATVALALPLYRSARSIRQAIMPVLIGVAAGGTVASLTAVWIAAMLGAPATVLHSIASKSVTAAISMAVAKETGGDPQLAAALSVLTGITGAVICVRLFDLLGVQDPRARGVATGVTAHGIGTARMLSESPEAGAFSSLAMGMTGVAAGILLPFIAEAL